MKILWAKTDFLHPTTRGGQIRTLEMLKHLHRSHQIHYVALHNGLDSEGIERSREYCSFSYPVLHSPISKRSPRFALQLARGLFDPLPVAGLRYRSQAMRLQLERLEKEHQFDAKVCDFLFPSANINDLKTWSIFQHNVETLIWERHALTARTALHRAYFRLQARKMARWERSACRAAARVIAVSEPDAELLGKRFQVEAGAIPTGVDTQYFQRPSLSNRRYDLVFVGSMDWMPNLDGMQWFLREVYPAVLRFHPACKLAIVGRNPPPSFIDLARQSPGVEVTGTVPDVRPYLWDSALSIVPLRIGGGTRLKIFEAMAAEIPVLSTSIGAEGLAVQDGKTILLADDAHHFSQLVIQVLSSPALASSLASQAIRMVVNHFSWEKVTARFEHLIAPGYSERQPEPSQLPQSR